MPTLNWIGKDAVVKHHLEVPFHLLKDVPELSCGDPGTGNIIAQGDNLIALKALLPHFAGQVKCVCIDPPYNTGNEGWAYNDNVNSPLIREWLGKVVGKEGETLDRHDRWLCMMYPRLALLRQFLSEDGVILVCLDDNEIHSLKYLLEEIFGSGNFVAQLLWEKGRKNDARFVSSGHEYVMVFAKNLGHLRSTGVSWRREKAGADEIHREFLRLRQIHGDSLSDIEVGIRQFYKSLPKEHPSKKHARYNKVDHLGVWRDDNMSWPGGRGPAYEVIHPATKKPCAIPEGGWRYSTPEKMAEMIACGKVAFRADHTEPPIRKTYLVREQKEEGDEDIGSEVMGSYFYRSGIQAANVLLDIFGRKVFENPKDHEVIGQLISYVTGNDKDCIVLDSFGGSGTTGHAVMSQNSLDGGNRKTILIEMEPTVSRDVTAERVRRVVEGYTNAKGERVAGLGGGFRFCELGEPLFDETGHIRETVKFGELARHVYFSETREPLPRERVPNTPLLGVCKGLAVYLLFNGILGDKSSNGGNVLTRKTLAKLPPFAGPKVIYCAGCLIGAERLAEEGITVRQTPYEIRVS